MFHERNARPAQQASSSAFPKTAWDTNQQQQQQQAAAAQPPRGAGVPAEAEFREAEDEREEYSREKDVDNLLYGKLGNNADALKPSRRAKGLWNREKAADARWKEQRREALRKECFFEKPESRDKIGGKMSAKIPTKA